MNCDSLGEQIAKFRKAQGLTQEDLAKSVGVSSQAVGMRRRAGRDPAPGHCG